MKMRISSFSALLATVAGQYNPTELGGLEKIVADVQEKCWNYIDTGTNYKITVKMNSFKLSLVNHQHQKLQK